MSELIPRPELPEPYGANYEGSSTTYPGEHYYRVYKHNKNGLNISVLLYYTNNKVLVLKEFGGQTIAFPTRQAMLDYIHTTCALDTWELRDED